MAYPPRSFHFLVSFLDVGDSAKDIGFQSVSGLNVSMDTESYREGGENRFVHQLPVKANYSDLTLKRGIVLDSELIKWCTDVFESMIIKPTDMVISLLNEEHEPLLSWNVKHAWPKKWTVSDLNAESSELVIESMELTYHYFTLIK
jgi:phage tail-like protein